MLQLDIPDGDYTLGEPSHDLLVGITSFEGGSEREFVPSVYTNVGYFRDWIDCIIEEKVCVIFFVVLYQSCIA